VELRAEILYISRMINFPSIDPVALQLGPLAIRWYALAYIAGVLLGWAMAARLAAKSPHGVKPKHIEDSLSWIILGIVLGGRIGYVLFYNLDFYLQHPVDALMLWHGGMAFHGGLLGVILATYLFCRRAKISYFAFTDIIACVVPIGLFFGRIANFINGELYGRTTDAPWGMVFPHGGDTPRHPSQLYQASMEGVLLFIIMAVLVRQPKIMARRGALSGFFLLFYGVFRAIGETFREPDAQIGFLAGGITMGQLLCIPMIVFGIYLILKPTLKS
jgi:phosphatidylglycerol:prolipoprotein diacylglycerol transferase